MKKTSFSTRAYIMKNGQVMIRVRWNSKKNEVGFSIGYTIDPLKWDSDKQLVKVIRPIKSVGRLFMPVRLTMQSVVFWFVIYCFNNRRIPFDIGCVVKYQLTTSH